MQATGATANRSSPTTNAAQRWLCEWLSMMGWRIGRCGQCCASGLRFDIQGVEEAVHAKHQGPPVQTSIKLRHRRIDS
jgi:hypothetical protein